MTAVLDDVLPVYRHRERHATQIPATPEAVWARFRPSPAATCGSPGC